MGIGYINAKDLNKFVAECDRLGGVEHPDCAEYISDFNLILNTEVNQNLDPFSGDYFSQQLKVYEEISDRKLNQAEGELFTYDVIHHAAAPNPYASKDIHLIAKHSRAVLTMLLIANPPPDARVLDLGCGWGLSSENIAFCGANVTAVDINPKFVELVRERAKPESEHSMPSREF